MRIITNNIVEGNAHSSVNWKERAPLYTCGRKYMNENQVKCPQDSLDSFHSLQPKPNVGYHTLPKN